MAYFAKTTGQGQGLAQVVKQDRVAEDYLEQERKRQEADAKRNSLIRKMDYLGNNLDGKYKEAFKQIYDDILSQVKDGQLSAQDGVGILEMNAKDLKSSQDQFVNYAKSDHSKDISWDKDKVSNPDTYLIDMLFGQDNEEDPFEAIKRATNIMARTESIPETLEEQFTKKYLPLLKQKENVFTQEEIGTKSDEELMKILKSTTRKVPQEILDQIEQGFVNDPEVQRAIVINNGMYKVQEDGVSVEDEANVDAFASDFFNKMTSPRVTIVEQERKDTGKGGLNFNFGGGRGENEKFYFEYQEKEVEPFTAVEGGKYIPRDSKYSTDRTVNVEAKGTNPYQDFRTGEGQEVMRSALVSIKLDKNGEPVSLILTDEEEVPYKENAFILDQEYGLTKENIKALYNQQQGNNQKEESQAQQTDEEIDKGYTFKGIEYTKEEVKEAADASGMTVKEYLEILKNQ